VNDVLRYAVKSYSGLLQEDEVPKDIYDSTRLPPPPRPGESLPASPGACPSCGSRPLTLKGNPSPHSRLNMFKKANDMKSNLILNLPSWVNFLGPKYCIFENVRGFLSYNLNAIQVDEHRTAGRISVGGPRFLVQAMLSMKYVFISQ
jgi:DNA (cytosine-5)-methyltransferase 1